MISSNRRRSRSYTVLILGAIVLVLAAAAFWRAPLQATLVQLFTPLLKARFAQGMPGVSQEALLADRDALYRENLDLKARLGRPVALTRVLAAVLMRPPTTPYDTLLIDAGSAQGLSEGDRISAGGTALVGLVSQVFAHSAKVTLYSAPGEKYEGLLVLKSGAVLPITLGGQGGGSLSAQVPAGSAVTAGDTVTLPGITGGFVGTVASVQAGADTSFATIYLTLPVNTNQLRYVEVWKSN